MPLRKLHHDSRHPFEYVMVMYMAFFGIVQIVFDVFPGAIDNYLSGGWKYGWGALFFFGAGLTLVGIIAKDDTRGLVAERVGLFWSGGACGLYAWALFSYGISTAWLTGGFFLAFALSCFLRSWIIRRDMKAIAGGIYTR